MSTAAPTFSQIRAQVAAIRKHAKESRVFGIYSPTRWNGESRQSFGDELYHIVQCDSPLALRVALQENAGDVTAKVLVTSIPTETLSADIRVRLARRKLYPIKNWQIVKELFQAKQLDPRIVEHNWIAERLLELAPPEGFPPVPSGVLDAETVWGILLENDLGMVVARPDLIALLKWSMDTDSVSRFRAQSDEYRNAATEWITQSAGPATDVVFACVEKNERPDALPVGLVMSVVYSPEAAASLTTEAARLEERYVGPNKINELNSRLWREAATNLVRLHLPDARVRSEWLSRADELLRDVNAETFAYVSRTSPLGFEQRLNDYGKALASAASSRVTEIPTSVDEAYRRIFEHEQARWNQDSRRMLRVQMSARLLRWLGEVNRAEREDSSLALACRRHATEGGFVDWARSTLTSNDHARDLTDAYNQLFAAANDVIHQRNRQFAKLVADWTQSGAGGDDVLPIEDVLEKFVSPLAAHAPLLVLVIDGMSFGVFRELVADMTRQDWVEIRRQDREPIWPAIATLPSLTEISRTSLLSGKLQQGNSTTERAAFESHSDLLHHCRPNSPERVNNFETSSFRN